MVQHAKHPDQAQDEIDHSFMHSSHFQSITEYIPLLKVHLRTSGSLINSLQEFSSHDNVIQLLNVIKARNDVDIYLVFEFMDTDLHAVIKAKILKPIHVQYIMYQVRCSNTNSLRLEVLSHRELRVAVSQSVNHLLAIVLLKLNSSTKHCFQLHSSTLFPGPHTLYFHFFSSSMWSCTFILATVFTETLRYIYQSLCTYDMLCLFFLHLPLPSPATFSLTLTVL